VVVLGVAGATLALPGHIHVLELRKMVSGQLLEALISCPFEPLHFALVLHNLGRQVLGRFTRWLATWGFTELDNVGDERHRRVGVGERGGGGRGIGGDRGLVVGARIMGIGGGHWWLQSLCAWMT